MRKLVCQPGIHIEPKLK